ncbi:hypothetical protein LINPERPRIM_LOCUS20826 [Linum perenne]
MSEDGEVVKVLYGGDALDLVSGVMEDGNGGIKTRSELSSDTSEREALSHMSFRLLRLGTENKDEGSCVSKPIRRHSSLTLLVERMLVLTASLMGKKVNIRDITSVGRLPKLGIETEEARAPSAANGEDKQGTSLCSYH